jgi:hypothetical protein
MEFLLFILILFSVLILLSTIPIIDNLNRIDQRLENILKRMEKL